MTKYLKNLIKKIEDDNTSIASEGTSFAEFDGYIDTGSLMFNAQISGTLRGGFPNNKSMCLAGIEADGKTFFAISMVKEFLKQHPEGLCFWYLAEPAVTKKMLEDRGLDTTRVAFGEPDTVQEWTSHMVKVLDFYMKDEEKRPPLIVVLDSLGALSTTKELSDASEGKETEDMTKAKKIKRAFRILDKKLARAKVPLVVTNHVYKEIGLFPTTEISGGSGLKYAGDFITILSATKDKEGEGKKLHVKGNIIKSYAWKNRFAKQFTTVELCLSFETGLDRYYGSLELAERHGIIKRTGSWYVLPSGEKMQRKDFSPEYWESILDQLDVCARKEFEYGQGNEFELESDNADLESANT